MKNSFLSSLDIDILKFQNNVWHLSCSMQFPEAINNNFANKAQTEIKSLWVIAFPYSPIEKHFLKVCVFLMYLFSIVCLGQAGPHKLSTALKGVPAGCAVITIYSAALQQWDKSCPTPGTKWAEHCSAITESFIFSE